MSNAPFYEIDAQAFKADPYPDLAKMRADGGIHFVPQLGATLFTQRADIFVCEKNIEVFSSRQPGGLMDVLMGQNMMRKDGDAHMAERRAVFPALSPRTVMDHWKGAFETAAARLLNGIADRGEADLVAEYAMPLSGAALQVITGLTNMSPEEMDRVSQGMIDGIANYAGDAAIEAHCKDCTASIDRHIDARLDALRAAPDKSLLSVQMQAGLPEESVRANVKLAISGGQNEPRDAIAGAVWAMVSHPDQLGAVERGATTWRAVFEEYARWISPIGMSPRRVDQAFAYKGVTFEPDERVFFMFGSANRDEAEFDAPDRFDVMRDTGRAIAFGAGPHFCAGAAASRVLIAEVALPMLFARLRGMRVVEEPVFEGWAFRGPLSLCVAWDV
ncbi:cytochrome P450 [Amylibacter sp. IMCC11727]|uniref:cytochrome P450 n=1 Tax=Amylibacter sp. IMCC11727 TaxID=3039851 RepID=UPI00244DAC36|nr:cytochrome P450 [Amylibacter sp. IMCC11727]WGI23365.1 cytochrome P450 [Amylibacter sp. IMCC11727]